MAARDINKGNYAKANRYANLIRNSQKRAYANRYIAWIVEGCVGLEPERGRLSYMAAQSVRLDINGMGLWERG